jgi:hypothetical protein
MQPSAVCRVKHHFTTGRPSYGFLNYRICHTLLFVGDGNSGSTCDRAALILSLDVSVPMADAQN